MEAGLRSRLMVLHVWCGVLSVTVVVIATLITTSSDQHRSAQQVAESVSTVKPQVASLPASISEKRRSSTPGPPLSAAESSMSYIQLISQVDHSWILDTDLSNDISCDKCSLSLQNNSIHCSEDGLYLLYIHVYFRKLTHQNRSIAVIKNPSEGLSSRDLVDIKISQSQDTVSILKIVSLLKEESIRIKIEGGYYNDNTYWGTVQVSRGARAQE